MGNQCTYDGNKCVCVPFRRLFARCLDKEFGSRREVIGYKLTPAHGSRMVGQNLKNRREVYRNIEITEKGDNEYVKILNGDKKGDKELLEEFLRADRVFQRKVKEYYEKMK
ncbi:hypothetical protein FOA43_002975 [Brettanomyces nanus]|uniref:Uncharacterized protein n=1 Tax=Eeniella nana TaxID=13502 RepID=A0A875S3T6_EENNA|nr:uncharacterized protein FOA43_002975 [Brettanomyces nanus]QPG75618.1 hypothetical protein FOA43_002975 [Brettanomyces nanus]